MFKSRVLNLSSRCLHSVANCTNIESNRLLTGLSKAGRLDEARKLFDKMRQRDEYAWNIMISAYASSGRFADAGILFTETPFKSSVTWSSLISGYCKYGCKDEAFDLFWQMQFDGKRPSQYTLGSVIKLCSSMGLLRRGEQIHGFALKTGTFSDVFVVTALVDMYAKCNCILEAGYLFESAADCKNHATWTAMLTGYTHNGEGLRALEFFRFMRAQGIDPNEFAFPVILTACAEVSAHDFGDQVHGCIVKTGFGANTFVGSALVDMYANCKDLNSAKRVLENMDFDDVISWNCLLAGCVREGLKQQALFLFQEMHTRSMTLDDTTYPLVLNSFASTYDEQSAKSVHCLIIKTGYVACNLVNNALIDMYSKQGKLECAAMVFAQMEGRDVISWTALVTGYSHNGSYEQAIKLFCEMRNAGVDLDDFIIASILSACAELTAMKCGQQVHATLMKSGLGSSLSVENSLISMYARCGDIRDANRIFDSMETRDVISWTALIVGYAQNGKGKSSIQFFDQMITTGTEPDFITFIGLLFACSHTGLVEEGRHYFESMSKVYGIDAGPEHYAIMIDLLGRSGNLIEAKELLTQMVVEPDATVWKALLAACRLHGELELGERAAMNLFRLEPFNAVPYVMLSNMYSAAGRWEDAARVRRLMKCRSVNKEPGCSWIETNSKVHSFVSEDRSHPMSREIYSKIAKVIKMIREAGYVPDKAFALHDTDDEGKETGLAYHSEKLAIAFGLLTVPLGAPIRIFKNLRVCGDCHSAIKYISRVYHRHIILRDSNCFHHFTEGKCSCSDYW